MDQICSHRSATKIIYTRAWEESDFRLNSDKCTFVVWVTFWIVQFDFLLDTAKISALFFLCEKRVSAINNHEWLGRIWRRTASDSVWVQKFDEMFSCNDWADRCREIQLGTFWLHAILAQFSPVEVLKCINQVSNLKNVKKKYHIVVNIILASTMLLSYLKISFDFIIVLEYMTTIDVTTWSLLAEALIRLIYWFKFYWHKSTRSSLFKVANL